MAKPAELRLPTKGLNEDGPPGSLAADEASQMINVLTHNSTALERRGPYMALAVDNDRTASQVPVGMAINGTNALITYAPVATDDTTIWVNDYYDAYGEPEPFNSSNFPGFVGLYASYEGTPTTVAATNYTNDISGSPDENILMPWGRSTYHEGLTYYPSIGSENTYAKIASAPTTVEGNRLVVWAGENKAATTHTTIASATVGSTTLTITGTPGDLTGKFFTFDGDRTTTVPYAYLIVEQLTTTTFRLSKPYGLGESAAANKTNQTGQSRSRDIPIQSPAGVYACATHLDRIFVGRARIRDQVGDLQPSYYPNALKWSRALSPEKWPDENVALVGSDGDDWITGLASLGRYLVVFKRYSTWVLAGDSEENFTLKRILGDVGCVDSRSIVEWNDSVIWGSTKGMHIMNHDLDHEELTQRAHGHGVRSTYQFYTSFASYHNADWNYPSVTACVDDNDYLHVMAYNDPQDALSGTGIDSNYEPFPMSCHIPTKSWTRLQGTSTATGIAQVASPKFYSCHRWKTTPVALAYETIMDLTYLANPSLYQLAYPNTSAGAEDRINNAGSEDSAPFVVDVVLSDQALNGYDSWSLTKLLVYHTAEYRSGTFDAGATGAVIYGAFDPVGENPGTRLPTSTLGAFKARYDTINGDEGQALYVEEINPRTSADEDAIRGQFLRLRLYDASTTMPLYWYLYKIVAFMEPGRAGRGTAHLL